MPEAPLKVISGASEHLDGNVSGRVRHNVGDRLLPSGQVKTSPPSYRPFVRRLTFLTALMKVPHD
ncbi:hypothetical protein [Kitasatospora kifunensis]|uniref:Uncharacterized protein n=1 Tax=Kitasatospora kifunensis TaxID=58351 RepID=A0A7W7VTW1_KITKI|nr:hypothetical protein [Kitasatospora kifunensis]MBB4922726.1 hypothetical protein [Kitasatospora kifunensis]